MENISCFPSCNYPCPSEPGVLLTIVRDVIIVVGLVVPGHTKPQYTEEGNKMTSLIDFGIIVPHVSLPHLLG